MTKRQVIWAATHDWFAGAIEVTPGRFEVLVYDRWTDRNGVLHEALDGFNCIHQLLVFAGY